MAFSYTDYTANGTATTFAITFPRINNSHVKVYQTNDGLFSLVSGTAYSVVANNVVFNAAPANANIIRVKRETPINARLVDFQNGSRLGESDLDNDSLQSFYLLQEQSDDQEILGNVDTSIVMGQCSRLTDGTIPITTQGTYVSVPAGVTATLDTAVSYGVALDTTTSGFALKNTSDIGRFFHVYASMDVTAGSNQNVGLRLNHIGGQGEIAATDCRAFTGSGTHETKLVTSWIIYMAPNTSVTMMAANHSGTNNITVKRARLVVSAV
jgi:hypothetical protein